MLSSRGGAVTLESDDTAVLFSLRGGAVKLKTDEDKYCYALGCNVGRQIGDLDCLSPEELDVVLLAVKDVLTKQEARVNLMELMPKAAEYFKAKHDAHLEKIEAASKEALVAAAAEEGATTTASGLVIKRIVEGEGEEPTASDTVTCHDVGKLADGSTFDSSLARGEPVGFSLAGVIQGWQEAIPMMRPGGKAKLTIPAELAYGEEGKNIIPPRATLIFEIELLGVAPTKKPAATGNADEPSEGAEDDPGDEEVVL